ncbi:MAG: Hsp70 family protein [Planctomycetes bacterium]|nr:Hsp70 family protein [Planctomycetota bacterium]
MSEETPYVVGIDLGTTNCAIAYVDTEPDPENPDVVGDVEVFEIEQLVRSGTTKGLIQLPSALYLPGEEVAEKAMVLPFEGPAEGTIHGQFALDQGSKVPHRLVSSSKSWLCHSGVDRRGPILPWGSDAEEVAKISPQEAARRLLLYLRSAWDATMAEDEPAYELAKQEIFLTVPASFDPEARDLTVEAARKAGLTKVTLLEEPQAAFYSWIEQQADGWRDQLAVGDQVLVFDVGGGTTDLTLISASEEDGNLVLERVAVGDHLLLGGDNMDLALAHVAAQKLGGNLDAWQSRALWLAARKAKEQLLSDPEKESADVVILGRGSKLIGGSQKTQLTREDMDAVVVNGFFPACSLDDRPLKRRGAGLSELGLPFEADPAITKHVAAFLGRQQGEGDAVYPSAVLFNGGVFKGTTVRERAVEVLNGWLKSAKRDPLKPLTGEDLDLAVARGAAYYGLVRRGRGVRIRGGTARTYYVGIESTMPAVPGMPPPLKALCVAPFGMEEGSTAEISAREFSLLVGEQAEFRFLGSTVRKEDQPGQLLDRWDEGELEELSPLQVTLEPGEGHAGGSMLPVTLSSAVTEIGTLEVHCVSRDGDRFKLEWNVREGEDEA